MTTKSPTFGTPPCASANAVIGSRSCAWTWASERACFGDRRRSRIVALLTLAIGIGANTAIFGVLRSVLLRPLPYPQPEQLVQIWSDHRAIGRAQPEWLTPPDFVDFRDGNSTFTSMAAYQGWGPDLTGSGDPQTVSGLLVTGNFFDVLQSKPAVGRLISRADDDSSAARVVVLTYQFWQRQFGGDRSVVGRQITLNGNPWTVAGVLSPEFRAPVSVAAPDIIAPSRRPPNGPCGRGCIVLRAIGRMKPNVTVGDGAGGSRANRGASRA